MNIFATRRTHDGEHKPLTADEVAAVERLRDAVEALPPRLILDMGNRHLTVLTLDSPGFSTQVASIPCRLN